MVTDGIDSLVLLSRDSDADRYVVTRDQQSNITALVDASNATLQDRYTCEPFGKRTIRASNGSTICSCQLRIGEPPDRISRR